MSDGNHYSRDNNIVMWPSVVQVLFVQRMSSKFSRVQSKIGFSLSFSLDYSLVYETRLFGCFMSCITSLLNDFLYHVLANIAMLKLEIFFLQICRHSVFLGKTYHLFNFIDFWGELYWWSTTSSFRGEGIRLDSVFDFRRKKFSSVEITIMELPFLCNVFA